LSVNILDFRTGKVSQKVKMERKKKEILSFKTKDKISIRSCFKNQDDRKIMKSINNKNKSRKKKKITNKIKTNKKRDVRLYFRQLKAKE